MADEPEGHTVKQLRCHVSSERHSFTIEVVTNGNRHMSIEFPLEGETQLEHSLRDAIEAHPGMREWESPAVFLGRLSTAPYLLDLEKSAQIETYSGTFQGYDEQVKFDLEELLFRGNYLMARTDRLSMGVSANQWISNVISWCEDSQTLVTKNLPAHEALELTTIAPFPSEEHTIEEIAENLHDRQGKLKQITMRFLKRT